MMAVNRSSAKHVLVLLGALAMSGCMSNGAAPTTGGGMFGMFGTPKASEKPADPELVKQFRETPSCPTVELRDGTELKPILSGNDLKFQAVIARFSRECASVPGGTRVKVGVGGRMLAGPKGGSGAEDLPVRIVLSKNGTDVIYSKIVLARAVISEPEQSTFWTVTDDGMVVPDMTEAGDFYQIYIGFDDAAKAPGKPKIKKKK